MTIRPSHAVLAVVLWAKCAVTWADPLDDGVLAYQRADYSVALIAFRSLAEQGSSAAQYNLAQMHRQGQGVQRDYFEAAKWYRLAAAQGDPESQYNLGVMHYNGQGVARSFVLSHMWLTLSAMSGAQNAVRNRAMLTKQMTSEQITEALERTRTCQQQNYKNCD